VMGGVLILVVICIGNRLSILSDFKWDVIIDQTSFYLLFFFSTVLSITEVPYIIHL